MTQGDSKVENSANWLTEQVQSATCFCKSNFIETQLHSFIYALVMAAFALQSWVGTKKAMRPTKLKLFTIWPFTEKCAASWYR